MNIYTLKCNDKELSFDGASQCRQYLGITEHHFRVATEKGRYKDYKIIKKPPKIDNRKAEKEEFVRMTYGQEKKEDTIKKMMKEFGLTYKQAETERHAAINRLKSKNKIPKKIEKGFMLTDKDREMIKTARESKTFEEITKKKKEPMKYSGSEGLCWVTTSTAIKKYV